ncbi:MAG: hypothetical protein ACRELG_29765 [Gemmataceae bacterium]
MPTGPSLKSAKGLAGFAHIPCEQGARLRFTLPVGSYATVLLREIAKSDSLERAAQEDSD